MATIGSAAAGSALAGSSWAGGVVPGPGDDFIITHALTLSGSWTVGTSGIADTWAGNINTGGSLTIQNGGALFARGSLGLNNGWLRIEGGGRYWWDASLAASPSTTSYYITFLSDSANTRLELAGTSNANRAVIDSVRTNGAAKGWISGQLGLNTLYIDANWFRLSEMGHHSTLNAITSSGFGARRYYFRNGIVEASVDRILANTQAATDVLVENMQFLQTERIELGGAAMPDPGKHIVVRDSYIGAEFWTGARAIDIRRTAFMGGIFSSEDTQYCSVWEDNFVVNVGDGGGGFVMFEPGTGAVLDRTFMLQNNPSATNPHWLGWRAGAPARTILMRGWIFEAVSPDSFSGDIIFSPTPAGRDLEVEQCITLPNPANLPPGCLVNKGHASPNQGLVRLRHCTIYTDGALSGLYTDESGVNAADSVPELRNNLSWSRTPRPGSLVYREAGSTAIIGVGSAWGHNAFHNVTNVTSPANPKLGYNGATAGALVSGTLSALTTDLDSVNPGFVDDARNLAKFGRDVGGYTGTDAAVRASVLAALQARPNTADANYNAAVSIPAILTFVAGGFAPTNAALQSASDSLVDGWRGAVEGITPGVQLNPDGTVSNTNWSAVGAGSLHAALAAGDADYITASADGATALLTLSDPVPNLTALTAGTLRFRHRVRPS